MKVILIIKYSKFLFLGSCADPEGGGGGQGVQTPLENHKSHMVSLEILVQTRLEKQLDPSPRGLITSRGESDLCEIR